jgi:hypothetical protein
VALPTGKIGMHNEAPAGCPGARAIVLHGDEEGEPLWLPFMFLARNELQVLPEATDAGGRPA